MAGKDEKKQAKQGRVSKGDNFFTENEITREQKIEAIITKGDQLRKGPSDLAAFTESYTKYLEAPERVFKREQKTVSKKMLLNFHLNNYINVLLHTKGSETQVINSVFELGFAVLEEFASHAKEFTGEEIVIRTEDISEVSARACAAIRQHKIEKV